MQSITNSKQNIDRTSDFLPKDHLIRRSVGSINILDPLKTAIKTGETTESQRQCFT